MGTEYTIQEGDCISSIAFKHGLFPDTIWNHPDNAELKNKRKEMNFLAPGDKVIIPEKEVKEESISTNQKHTFKKKGVPARLRLKILKRTASDAKTESKDDRKGGDNENPEYEQPEEKVGCEEEGWADCPFWLEIDGKVIEDTTDGSGCLDVFIPPDAAMAKLTMNPNEPDQMIIQLTLGTADSEDEISGVKKRLANLGFDCGEYENAMSEEFSNALRLFQEHYGLEISGEVDDATRTKLQELRN